MKLIVGLGNIGEHFEGTRHNVGFQVMGVLAGLHNFSWTKKASLKAQLATGELLRQKVILARPSTYYNLSGEAVAAILRYHKLTNHDLLVVHDELDLTFGTLRTRLGGSDAGNNGIKSITDHIGADFTRLRIGIANEHLPKTDAAEFVLGWFSHDEKQQLPGIIDQAISFIERFVDENQEFMHTSVKLDAKK